MIAMRIKKSWGFFWKCGWIKIMKMGCGMVFICLAKEVYEGKLKQNERNLCIRMI